MLPIYLLWPLQNGNWPQDCTVEGLVLPSSFIVCPRIERLLVCQMPVTTPEHSSGTRLAVEIIACQLNSCTVGGRQRSGVSLNSMGSVPAATKYCARLLPPICRPLIARGAMATAVHQAWHQI